MSIVRSNMAEGKSPSRHKYLCPAFCSQHQGTKAGSKRVADSATTMGAQYLVQPVVSTFCGPSQIQLCIYVF